VSFDDAFLKLGYADSAVLFDGSINKEFVEKISQKNPEFNNPGFSFKYQNISAHNSNETNNLHSLIESHDNIFVKMDIEGFEYEWVNSLSEEHLNSIDQICIEFHEAHLDEKRWEVFSKLNRSHFLVHVHTNNWKGILRNSEKFAISHSYVNINGVIIPRVMESTYIHKKFLKNPSLNKTPFPLDMEYSNFIDRPEYVLSNPPFCFRDNPDAVAYESFKRMANY
jgi:hypothetical protein